MLLYINKMKLVFKKFDKNWIKQLKLETSKTKVRQVINKLDSLIIKKVRNKFNKSQLKAR